MRHREGRKRRVDEKEGEKGEPPFSLDETGGSLTKIKNQKRKRARRRRKKREKERGKRGSSLREPAFWESRRAVGNHRKRGRPVACARELPGRLLFSSGRKKVLILKERREGGDLSLP